MLLAARTLPEGWINASLGEPIVVRDVLYGLLGADPETALRTEDAGYPFPEGYSPLREWLERKFNTAVLITNGGTHGLHAAMYAAKQLGYTGIYSPLPYWVMLPEFAKQQGMTFRADDGHHMSLYAVPNNPDGALRQPSKSWCIHDAAYYHSMYLPAGETLPDMSSTAVSVYSGSKLFGLPGLRIGFVVCREPSFYEHLRKYIEISTSGVSILSQQMLFSLLKRFGCDGTSEFGVKVREALDANRKIIAGIDPNILQPVSSVGMFGWFKGDKERLTSARVLVTPGEAFGAPGYVRLNLALRSDVLREIVARINALGHSSTG